ncbi:DUF2249 domain-containing protein [Oerskovia turbata]|uniref:DUF2249 domain-containing protein n=1 Tax=Oerskovia turbata TaxID=1713 RepID=A0A4Q1L3W0_9CELL|nr:DUF2249 domain-containing protein [Oerskovia turbata]RXR36526.1 DUF2249 domain-containing protein [Oerskovia turbata]TGJ97539.1 DUF2249 domain-containing protein [Actinotalea fermentans ATCC 43279 = JCM 9966 = DSM 3133]
MSTIVLATSAEDSRAVEAVVAHHTEMNGTLTLLVEMLVQAVEAGDATAGTTAHQRLVDWTRTDLLPHALAEEDAMYPHAHRDEHARLLVDAMITEHGVISGLVDSLADATSPVRAAALGRALQVLFDVHMTKENDQILPLLAQSTAVSLATVLDGMHELLGGHEHSHDKASDAAGDGCGCGNGGCGGGAATTTEAPAADTPAAPAPGGHSCGCGGHDDAGNLPVLDARAVPHAIRHATIFGALDGVAPGAGMVLLAPHDPLPLLAQIDARWPGTFTVDYLERGPETWALAFMR